MHNVQMITLGIAFVFFASCSGQSNKAVEDQKKAYQALQQYTPTGEAPRSDLHMKATIDGKPWVADKLIPDPDTRSNSYHVSGSANDIRIGFDVWVPRLKAGDVIEFKEGHAADLTLSDDVGFYAGRTGKFTVTKVDGDGFEGTFYFTANTVRGPQKHEITNGELRFPWPKRS
jgi:hypothetical protein